MKETLETNQPEDINLVALEKYCRGVYAREGALALRSAIYDLAFNTPSNRSNSAENHKAVEDLLGSLITRDIIDEAKIEAEVRDVRSKCLGVTYARDAAR